MSDRMTPIPFQELVTWVLEEKKKYNTVFGLHRSYVANPNHKLELFGEYLETPFGPAAGPNSQLAQNIIASYYAGSRFFELKTVQKIDGEDLPVSKPCIVAEDECYNCEWSTELRVQEAFDEYVKAWFLLKVMAKEFGLGATDGFMFNMSVGYDLEGIKLKKIDDYIEGMKDATNTAVYQECKAYLKAHLGDFEKFDAGDLDAITPKISNSITLSTLHGCPPQEIERIATYLIEEKKLNTFIKCNPTLLGYDFARKTMDEMGYDYIAFGDFHFKDDLQYEDAVPMLTRLMTLSKEKNLNFGVKITNTFPVDVTRNELPSEEMYMSGRSLYPLSIALAANLAKEFNGELRISYSGGADYHNIKEIYEAGIWPITVATTILKPGGYQRLEQLGQLFEDVVYDKFTKVDTVAAQKLKDDASTNPHNTKAVKPAPSRKMEQEVPLMDCFVAPCQQGCPIHQDITSYMKEVGNGNYLEAMKIIVDKNPLPFITGTICAHRCMSKCTRNFYDESVQIRSAKLEAAEGGYDQLIKELKAAKLSETGKTAVIGGGPAGLAAAFFLARGGVQVTIYEKKETLGGVIRHIIPEFRIATDAIEKDAALVKHMGVEVKLKEEVKSVAQLKEAGFENVILCLGAWNQGILKIEDKVAMNALSFLEEFKKTNGQMDLGKNVVVIGGGNTAMDTARAAKRVSGVEKVSLVYRRTKRYMPADEEELVMAMEDGVEFKELLAPVRFEDGQLICHKMELGEMDASGRCKPIETNAVVKVLADTVIAAVGEKTDVDFYQANGIEVDKYGKPVVNAATLESNVQGVYAAGDGLFGPATVVEAIRDASKAAEAILSKAVSTSIVDDRCEEKLYAKKGFIIEANKGTSESERCLVCSAVCENCVDVCPNRANVSIKMADRKMAQVIHVDKMCNECGNCLVFCPYSSAPYKDKFTLFANEVDFADSTNQGFVLVDEATLTFKVRLAGNVRIMVGLDGNAGIDSDLEKLIATVYNNYKYLY